MDKPCVKYPSLLLNMSICKYSRLARALCCFLFFFFVFDRKLVIAPSDDLSQVFCGSPELRHQHQVGWRLQETLRMPLDGTDEAEQRCLAGAEHRLISRMDIVGEG